MLEKKRFIVVRNVMAFRRDAVFSEIHGIEIVSQIRHD